MSTHKVVGDSWTWFSDYVCTTSEWKISTDHGRRVQVGMGVFADGEPRGEKVAVTSEGGVTTIGAGSIHIRVYDGGGTCNVWVEQRSCNVIPIIRCNTLMAEAKALADGKPSTLMDNPHLSPTALSLDDAKIVEDFNAALRNLLKLGDKLHGRGDLQVQ